MKTIVSMQDVAELEIKPAPEVTEWRRLVEAELAQRWKGHAGWVTVACPACGGAPLPAFARLGVRYGECRECGSLFAVERPTDAMVADYYRASAPARFWRDTVLPASAEARLEKIVQPRVQWVMDGIAEYDREARDVRDVSSFGEAFVTELQRAAPALRVQTGGSGSVDAITAFDVLDRTSDVPAWAAACATAVRPGGLLFVTAPTASGFEVQVLWERSPTATPPDKLNLPTVEGLLKLFGPPHWDVLELSTPGVFDVEIVRHAVEREPDAPWPRMVRYMLTHRDQAARQALVEFLQSQRLTSFARLVARRRG